MVRATKFKRFGEEFSRLRKKAIPVRWMALQDLGVKTTYLSSLEKGWGIPSLDSAKEMVFLFSQKVKDLNPEKTLANLASLAYEDLKNSSPNKNLEDWGYSLLNILKPEKRGNGKEEDVEKENVEKVLSPSPQNNNLSFDESVWDWIKKTPDVYDTLVSIRNTCPIDESIPEWIKVMLQDTKTPRQGRVIAFEGVPFSGKSTQADMLCDWLKTIGKDAVIYSSPSESIKEKLNFYLEGGVGNGDIYETILLFSSELYKITGKIKSDVASGKWVLLDSYSMLCHLYGFTLGLSREWLSSLTSHLIKPNLTIYLDIPLSEVALRGNLQADSQKSISEVFRVVANDDTGVYVPASGTPEVVSRRVLSKLVTL